MQLLQSISVLIVDHHPAFLQMITRFLDQQCSDRIIIVGAVFRPADALALAAARRPQIVVLGLNGDTQVSLALIAPLRTVLPNVGIIASAQLGLAEYQQAALVAGADRFISTDLLHRDLLPMIRTLADSRTAPPAL
jgi:DNA-binding NarL/FixJ family response regulator